MKETTVVKVADEGLSFADAMIWPESMNSLAVTGTHWVAIVPEPLPAPLRQAMSHPPAKVTRL
jgi:hypothetical protein